MINFFLDSEKEQTMQVIMLIDKYAGQKKTKITLQLFEGQFSCLN